MKNKIKTAFLNICVSDKLDMKILNMTINKKEKKYRQLKLSYVCSIVLLIFLLSVTVVSSKEIKKFFESWGTFIELENGTKINVSENNNFKEIPNSAIKVKQSQNRPQMTYGEIEKMLGFSILKLPKENTKEIYYGTGLNKDETIGRIDLWIPYFIKESEIKYISCTVSMLNKYADEGYVLAFNDGLDVTGGKNIENSYKSKNLNTNVVLYTNNWSTERVTATFVYDDILYEFVGKNMSKDEMISIIDTLE